uniref:Uncharacterized protein n=1 Tax=Mus spicilegus TaxID=10103 RepID=A0A8C6IAT1_MUSSI
MPETSLVTLHTISAHSSQQFPFNPNVYCFDLIKRKIFHQITQENPGSRNIYNISISSQGLKSVLQGHIYMYMYYAI